MKAFVKTAVPLVCLCIAGLLYNVIGNVSDTMKVSVQSKALSSLDDALQAAAEDNEPYPTDQKAFEKFAETSLEGQSDRKLMDAWDMKLVYSRMAQDIYVIGSAGSDRKFGTDDDIYLKRSGKTREMTHSLKQVARNVQVAGLGRQTSIDKVVKSEDQDAESGTSDEQVHTETASDSVRKIVTRTFTLEETLKELEGDPRLKNLIQKILDNQAGFKLGSAENTGQAIPAALLALGTARNNSLVTEDQSTAQSTKIQSLRSVTEITYTDKDDLLKQIRSYTELKGHLESVLKKRDFQSAQRALQSLMAQAENAHLEKGLFYLTSDLKTVQNFLERFLEELEDSIGTEMAFGSKRGIVTEIRDDLIVLKSGTTKMIIESSKLRPEWIKRRSDLPEMATDETLYGLGVLYFLDGKDDQATAVFRILADWHEGARRHMRWAQINREAEASSLLDEIQTVYKGGNYTKVKSLLAKVRGDYANSSIVTFSSEQLQEWDQGVSQKITERGQRIKDAIARLDKFDGEIKTNLNAWAKTKSQTAQLLYEEKMPVLEKKLADLIKKKEEGANLGRSEISNVKREIKRTKAIRHDRIAALKLRFVKLKNNQRNDYLRLRRKILNGEEVAEDTIREKLDGLRGKDEPDAGKSVKIEPRIKKSQILESRYYVFEYNGKEEDAKALGTRMDIFYVHIIKMFARSDVFKEILKKTEGGNKMTVRYLRDSKSFKEYIAEYRPNAPEWSAGYYDGKELVFPHTGHFGTAYHEGFHQIVDRVFPKGGETPWFNEGLAEYYEKGSFKGGGFVLPEQMGARQVKAVQDAIRTGKFISLTNLLKLSGADWSHAKEPTLQYAEAYTFIHFLINYPDKRVAKVFRTFMEQLGKTGKYDESLNSAFEQVNMQTLQKLWKSWIIKAGVSPAKSQNKK